MSLVDRHSQGSLIGSFIHNNIITRPVYRKQTCGTRPLGQTVAVVLGFGGRVPFISIARKASANVAYGWALAGFNTVSFAALFSWSMLKMVNGFTEPISSEEARLLSRKQNPCIKLTVYVASVFLGVLSLIPQAYFAYVYNSKNFIYPATLLICDSGLPSLSMKMTFDKLLSPKETDTFVLQTRLELINLVQQFQEQIITTPLDEANELKRMTLREEGAIIDQSVYELLEVAMTNSYRREEPSGLSCKKVTMGIIQGIAGLVGVVLAIAQLALLFVACVKFMEMVGAGAVAGYILGTAVSLVNAYLAYNILVLGPINLAKRGVNLVTCQFTPSLPEKISALSFYILMTIGTVFACFSYGPNKTFAEDYFGQYKAGNLNAGDAMEVILPAGVAVLIINAVGDIFGDIIKAIASKKGTQSTKDLIYLDNRLDRLKRLFADAPFHHVAEFLKSAPDSFLKKLGKEPVSFQQELEKYERNERLPLIQ